jgi:lambda family phage portal protein
VLTRSPRKIANRPPLPKQPTSRLTGHLRPAGVNDQQELKRLRHNVKALQSALASQSFETAKKNRLNRERSTTGGTGDEHLDESTLWDLREISRDVDRNNGLAIGIIDRVVENVLGPVGFDLLPKTGHDKLNLQIQDDYRDFLSRVDIRGEFGGWELMSRCYRAAEIDGDFFMQWDQSANNGEGALRGFEADRVLSPFSAASTGATAEVGGRKLINGIARDTNGRKRWMFVANDTPTSPSVRPDQGRVIPADRVIQIYDPRRWSQNRSEPRLAPVIRDIDDLDDLLLYERIAAKVVAAQAYFVKTESPEGAAAAMESPVSGDTSVSGRIQEVLPGSVNYLDKGDDIAASPTNRPSDNFEAFVKLLNRYVGLPLGLPYELVLMDFSNVNFASSRQLLNQAQRRWKCQQTRVGKYSSQVYRFWLEARVAAGHYKRYKKPITSGSIYRHEWGFPGWPSPNPLQDAQAIATGLEGRFESRTNANRSRGVAQSDIFDELEREAARSPEPAQSGSADNPADDADTNNLAAVSRTLLILTERLADLEEIAGNA